ncbi:Peroxidase 46 [Hibiscus syriacus]|uniref:Peroxidase n=1 Tax=Hibiscus syriacus TaxID=106335 RepID=A0A6A2W9G7_HIBSY|nr:Peroxidase 46 [Hibiscus syriacus]
MATRASMDTKIAILLAVLLSFAASPSRSRLSFDFYVTSCPAVEFIVSNTVRSVSSSDPTIHGKLLRLLLHDCFVEISSDIGKRNREKRSGKYFSSEDSRSSIRLNGNSKSSALEAFLVLVALAARDAVVLAGGPAFPIPTGRRDEEYRMLQNVRLIIADTSFTTNEMIELFKSKGLSLDDLVTLSVGSAHCNAFSDRFRMDLKGKLTLIDKSLDCSYAEHLMKKCSSDSSASKTVDNDLETFAFDNQYYSNLVAHKGLFQSDSVLIEDGRTREKVEAFANDQESFFMSWGDSFLKLTSIGVKTDDEGEIRRSCSFAN